MKIIKYNENIYIHSQIIEHFKTGQNLKTLTLIWFFNIILKLIRDLFSWNFELDEMWKYSNIMKTSKFTFISF